MAARTLPNVGLKGFWGLSFDGWDAENDLNLLVLSVLVQGVFLSKEATTPGSPSDGEVYLFDETHATQANKLAIRDDGAWVYVTPQEGWKLYNQALNYFEHFDGSVWAEYTPGSGGVDALNPIEETAAYTPVLADGARQYITIDSATDVDLTIPAEADENFPIMTEIYIEAVNTGMVTVVGDTGVTVNSRDGLFTTAGTYSVLVAVKKGSDEWTVAGDVA